MTTIKDSPVQKSFDVNKYKIVEDNQIYTVKINDDEFDVTVKPVTWQLKNELIAKCMKFDQDGNSSFDGGTYIKEVLKAIIVEAPWGKTDNKFLDSINSDLGAALERLVPSAFDTNFNEVDVVKKE